VIAWKYHFITQKYHITIQEYHFITQKYHFTTQKYHFVTQKYHIVIVTWDVESQSLVVARVARAQAHSTFCFESFEMYHDIRVRGQPRRQVFRQTSRSLQRHFNVPFCFSRWMRASHVFGGSHEFTHRVFLVLLAFPTVTVQRLEHLVGVFKSQMRSREVGVWGRDPKKCTGRDWWMGSSTI